MIFCIYARKCVVRAVMMLTKSSDGAFVWSLSPALVSTTPGYVHHPSPFLTNADLIDRKEPLTLSRCHE